MPGALLCSSLKSKDMSFQLPGVGNFPGEVKCCLPSCFVPFPANYLQPRPKGRAKQRCLQGHSLCYIIASFRAEALSAKLKSREKILLFHVEEQLPPK